MNGLRKTLVIICTVALVLSSFISFADNQAYFDSLKNVSNWAKDEVENAINSGRVTEGLFLRNYQGEATREEFAEYALAIYEYFDEFTGAKSPEIVETPFTDTDKDFIKKIYSCQIIAGVSETKFDPDGYLTREQLCTILHRLISQLTNGEMLGITSPELVSDYADMEDVSFWAADSVIYMNSIGVLKGNGNKLDPKGLVTREQAILMALRLDNALSNYYLSEGNKDEQLSLEDNRACQILALVRVESDATESYTSNLITGYHDGATFVNFIGEEKFNTYIPSGQGEDNYYFLPAADFKDVVSAMYYDKRNSNGSEYYGSLASDPIPELISVDYFYTNRDGVKNINFPQYQEYYPTVEFFDYIKDESGEIVGYDMLYTGDLQNAEVHYAVYFEKLAQDSVNGLIKYGISKVEKR